MAAAPFGVPAAYEVPRVGGGVPEADTSLGYITDGGDGDGAAAAVAVPWLRERAARASARAAVPLLCRAVVLTQYGAAAQEGLLLLTLTLTLTLTLLLTLTLALTLTPPLTLAPTPTQTPTPTPTLTLTLTLTLTPTSNPDPDPTPTPHQVGPSLSGKSTAWKVLIRATPNPYPYP